MNWREQRREPVIADLAMGVQEDDNLAASGDRAIVPTPDQPLSLRVPDDSNASSIIGLLHFLVELLVQVFQL